MNASRQHNDVVSRLRQSGITYAIDDFDTGYSSLDYLRRFPAARVKIARDFIGHISDDPGSAAIVRATIALAREMGMVTIAEDVETSAARVAEDLGMRAGPGLLLCEAAQPARPAATPASIETGNGGAVLTSFSGQNARHFVW